MPPDGGCAGRDSGAGSGDREPRWVEGILITILAAGVLQALFLSLDKHFSTDEFGYAHMAWLLAKGSIPYRDFFDAHPPLLTIFLSSVFRWGGDAPHLILCLRVLMLLPLAASLWAAARLSRPAGTLATLLAPLLMLATPGYIRWVTEVRPDALAFALFLCAAGLLDDKPFSPRIRFALVGVLAAAACWTTIKAVFPMAGFAVLGTVHLWKREQGLRRAALPSLCFLAGFASLSLALLGYLAKTGTVSLAWQSCAAWSVQQQAGVPSFPWRRYFDPIMRDHVWILALAILGLTLEVARVRREKALSAGRALLAMALPLALLSHVVQRTAYPYNLIPWIGLLTIWAASGAGWLLKRRRAWSIRLVSLVFCASLLLQGELLLLDQMGESNAQQREVLGQIERLTSLSDCVYDNAGSAVTRPHAHYHFYTDAYMRRALAPQLIEQVPPALIARQCVMRVLDLRSEDLPGPLLGFLRTHYQPVNGDLALWGQRYRLDAAGGADFEFLALAGEYFTFPKVPLAVDGRPVLTDTFHLEAGTHRLRYDGSPGEFYVLWLPRDGRPWQPQFGLPPRFSKLF